jgi:diguanylate cyclase (GGDEF)-like protein/PAS domain S-box-containing protein
VSRLRLLLFDQDWLDHALFHAHLTPHYSDGVLFTVSRSEQEFFEKIRDSNPSTFDAVILAAPSAETDVSELQALASSHLPPVPIIIITDSQSDSAFLTRVDRSRVSILPIHQLARLPFILDRWTMMHRLDVEALSDLPETVEPSIELYQLVANLTADYVYLADVDQDGVSHHRYRGEALCRMTGYSNEEINALGSEALIHPEDRPLFRARRASLLRGEPRTDEIRLQTRSGRTLWIRDYAYPILNEGNPFPVRIVGAAQDITNEKLLQNRLTVQASLLEMITRGEPVSNVLHALTDAVEEQIPDTICSIQLVHQEKNVLRSEVSHGLPDSFLDALGDIPIASDKGACGSAAYYKALTITPDIERDPRFDDYREIMRDFHFEAVWSTPVFSAAGDVVGTFALYFRTTRTPLDYEIEFMESAAQIAGIALDVSERETARQLAQIQYQTLVEQTPAVTLIADADDPRCLTYLSPQFSDFSEAPPEQILRNPERVRSFVHPDDRGHFDLAVDHSRATGEPLQIEFRIRRATGAIAWLQTRISLIRDKDGNPLHWLGLMLDVTDRNEAIRQMVDSERRYRSLFDENLNAIVIYDYEGRVVDLNPAAERISGYSAEELKGNAVLWMMVPEDRDRAERYFLQSRAGVSCQFSITMLNRQGERIELSASQNPIVVDDEVIGVSSIAEDVTDRRRLESQLLYQAYHDSLTQLPNRVHFDRTLSMAMSALRRSEELAVLFMDLNDFKIINDSLGHDVGDKYLRSIGERLRNVVPDDATVSRFGGDEFTVLLPAVTDAVEAAISIARMIIAELATPVTIDGYELGTNVSVGIARTSLESLCEPGELIRRADIALYDAKRGSRESNYRVFDEGMDEWVFERLWVEGDLRQAMANGEFVIHYQPLIDGETREVMVVEALLRWQHPTRGLLIPDRFLRIAEESGHILEIDQWVMRTACQQVAEWNARYPEQRPVYLGVNISTRQFWNAGFAERVRTILDETGLDPTLLCIEITESTMMRDAHQASSAVRELREHGVLFAIDDFGTGYSSLSYLKQFPIDVLKIDRSFIRRIDEDEQQFELAKAIVSMARALDLVVVAEGVESSSDLESAQMLNCDLLQGYFISRPVPFRDVEHLINRQLLPSR